MRDERNLVRTKVAVVGATAMSLGAFVGTAVVYAPPPAAADTPFTQCTTNPNVHWRQYHQPVKVRNEILDGPYPNAVLWAMIGWNDTAKDVVANDSDWDLVFRTYNVNDISTGYFDPILPDAHCGYEDGGVMLNRANNDSKQWQQVANSTTHEMGHGMGLTHWASIWGNCSADSIMLDSRAKNWNSYCTWNSPHSEDSAAMQTVYGG